MPMREKLVSACLLLTAVTRLASASGVFRLAARGLFVSIVGCGFLLAARGLSARIVGCSALYLLASIVGCDARGLLAIVSADLVSTAATPLTRRRCCALCPDAHNSVQTGSRTPAPELL